ncbi:MAG: metal-sensitive transcriptional regulator [Deltaproteobacteria bacterium]|nr:metal-sensitive transcriptional regulator [Deltaproteobacteria bacterium]
MRRSPTGNCCDKNGADHPDHTKELHRINRISGQVEGVKRMITEREYCPKIITQIQAIRAALKVLETTILKKHLETCVKDAFTSNSPKEKEKKLEELLELIRRS